MEKKSIIESISGTVTETAATTIGIDTKESSWGVFCFNPLGDLFLNSDWGSFVCSFRSFGPGEFRSFLASVNAEYLVTKFSSNYHNISGKKLSTSKESHLMVLTNTFINHLKDGKR